MSERILITGGAGFIGAALADRLRADGLRVTAHDSRLPGEIAIADAHRFAARSYDIRSREATVESFDGGDFETVFHLAAMNGATRDFYERPYEVLDVQIRGTLNVIDACVKHGVKTLVLFSSSEVYQTAPVIPTPEDVPRSIPDITNPRYSYAVGKIAAEALAWHSSIERVVLVLPHNVYGTNAGYGHVIPELILRASRTPDRGEFPIYGAATRSFIYIDDFVSAMMAIWQKTEATEGRVREIYHVGTEEQTSTTALAGQICRLMGRVLPDGRYPFKFRTHDAPVGSTRSRCPDTRKLRSLGWEAKVGLEEGLRRTIEAYRAKESEWPA